jgi:hypothetical protein
MKKSIVILLLLSILLGCRGQNSNIEYQPNLRNKNCFINKESAQEIDSICNILNDCYKNNDYVRFVSHFPNTYESFKNAYSLEHLDSVYYGHITFLFEHESYPIDSLMKKIINISCDAKWEPDAIDLFQEKSIEFIEKHPDSFISELGVREVGLQNSVLFFLLDGACSTNYYVNYKKCLRAFNSYPHIINMVNEQYRIISNNDSE